MVLRNGRVRTFSVVFPVRPRFVIKTRILSNRERISCERAKSLVSAVASTYMYTCIFAEMHNNRRNQSEKKTLSVPFSLDSL